MNFIFETFIFPFLLLFLGYKTLELLYNFCYLFIKLLKDEEKDKFEIIKFSFFLILIISFSILGIIEYFEPYSMLGKFSFLLPTGPIIFSYIFCVLPYKNEDGIIDYNHGKEQ